MDKKLFNKSSNFFKREGFYVLLFVCLCIVATVAVVTSRTGKIVKTNPQQPEVVAQQDTEKQQIHAVAEKPKADMENALQVKKNANTNTPNVQKSEAVTAPVSKTSDTSFIKPVEGNIARAYSEELVYWKSTQTNRPNFGIDIKSELGKNVVAVLDGKVESVDKNTVDGVQVIINHQNGLKTIYSNLDPKINVTEGQTVSKGTVIGKVGESTVRAAYEEYGKNYLHFAVKKGNEFIDPAKYVKY